MCRGVVLLQPLLTPLVLPESENKTESEIEKALDDLCADLPKTYSAEVRPLGRLRYNSMPRVSAQVLWIPTCRPLSKLLSMMKTLKLCAPSLSFAQAWKLQWWQ